MGLWLRSLLKEICLEQHAARIERWLQQHSGQTLGMRVGIDSGRPRANFPRKISKGNRKAKPLSLGRDEKNRKVTRNL